MSELSAQGTATIAVDAKGLSRSFREGEQDRRVLDGLDLEVGQSEFVALLGRSGSGKSTLLHLIAGIDAPDSGSVRVAGCDLHALSERDRSTFRRDHIGIVFQFFRLIPTLTVEENVLLPIDLGGRVDAKARSRARDLLDSVGLADRLATFPEVLSGGEQQRVGLARALINDPDVLLADEPTGNLDAEAAAAVLELLLKLSRDTSRAVVMVTHSDAAAKRADRSLRLVDGRVHGGADREIAASR